MNADSRTFSRWLLFCTIGLLVTSWLAFYELNRIENGRLFLFPLPWDAPPSEIEILDSQHSASQNKYLAIAALVGIGVIVAATGPVAFQVQQLSSWTLAIFALAVVADLGTTIRFFHSHGIENELHPGIRLFGYAYGRTVGPILGKSLQTLGVLLIARLFKQHAPSFVRVVAMIYLAAAIYNIL
jgi:hypothetical protein